MRVDYPGPDEVKRHPAAPSACGPPIKGEEVAPMLAAMDSEAPTDWKPVAECHYTVLAVLLVLLFFIVPTLMIWDVFMLIMREPNLSTSAALITKLILLVVASCAACRSRPAKCGKRGLVLACVLSTLCGLAVTAGCVKALLVDDYDDAGARFPIIEGNSSAAPRVAIIGAGPSGMGALWALKLHAPERDVTIFEMTDSVGGHGTTVHDRGKPIDIGFIFSTPTYPMYHALRARYGHTVGASNISLTYHGDEAEGLPRWDNSGRAETSPALAAEIERFREEARTADGSLASQIGAPPPPLEPCQGRWPPAASRARGPLALRCAPLPPVRARVLGVAEPLWLWLWRKGFSKEFTEGVLRPMLTPLFVTARGNMIQSAGATREYFKLGGGMPFLSLDLEHDGAPPVYHTMGGVNALHAALLDEAKPPPEAVRLNTEVVAVRRTAEGKWRVTWRKTTGLVGGRCDAADGGCLQDHAAFSASEGAPTTSEDFDTVVMACSAQIAAKLLPAGALRTLLGTVDYDAFRVTLSEPAESDDVRTDPSLYHVYPQGLMSGAIDRIDEVAATDCGAAFCPGEYKLEVEPDDNPERDASHYGKRVIATRQWAHHRFSLYEIITIRRLLPRLNHVDGLHIAGDYVYGYGHEDALRSGLAAACRIGLAAKAKALIHSERGLREPAGNHCPYDPE